MNKLEIVKIINGLINAAIMHGADAGGSYDSNEEELKNKLQDAINYFALDEYRIGYITDPIYNIGLIPKTIISNGYNINEIKCGMNVNVTFYKFKDNSYENGNGEKTIVGTIISYNNDKFEIEWEEKVSWTDKIKHKKIFHVYDILLGQIEINSIG